MGPLYLYNENPYNGKTVSLYRNDPQLNLYDISHELESILYMTYFIPMVNSSITRAHKTRHCAMFMCKCWDKLQQYKNHNKISTPTNFHLFRDISNTKQPERVYDIILNDLMTVRSFEWFSLFDIT